MWEWSIYYQMSATNHYSLVRAEHLCFIWLFSEHHLVVTNHNKIHVSDPEYLMPNTTRLHGFVADYAVWSQTSSGYNDMLDTNGQEGQYWIQNGLCRKVNLEKTSHASIVPQSRIFVNRPPLVHPESIYMCKYAHMRLSWHSVHVIMAFHVEWW